MTIRLELRNLSQELWAKVFAMLKPTHVEEDCDIALAAPQYYQLHLVSKGFREVFIQNPHLCSLIYLHGPSNGSSLKSLLQRLSTQPVAVEELVLEEISKQDQENILVALLARPQRSFLATFCGSDLSATAVSFLAEFQSLKACDLAHTQISLLNSHPYKGCNIFHSSN